MISTDSMKLLASLFIGSTALLRLRRRSSRCPFGGALPARLDTWLKNSIGCNKEEVLGVLKHQRVHIECNDGVTTLQPGAGELLFPGDLVFVDGVQQTAWKPSTARLFALHMPKSLRMAHGSRKGGKVQQTNEQIEQLGRRNCFISWKEEIAAKTGVARLFAIGRLDRKTSGLLLVTNDGELSFLLCSEGQCAKEYIVMVNRAVTEEKLEKLRQGVQLSDQGKEGKACFAKVRSVCLVRQTEKQIVVTCMNRQDCEPTQVTQVRAVVRVVIDVGYNHVIKRLLDAVGLSVVELHRARVGPLELAMTPECVPPWWADGDAGDSEEANAAATSAGVAGAGGAAGTEAEAEVAVGKKAEAGAPGAAAAAGAAGAAAAAGQRKQSAVLTGADGEPISKSAWKKRQKLLEKERKKKAKQEALELAKGEVQAGATLSASLTSADRLLQVGDGVVVIKGQFKGRSGVVERVTARKVRISGVRGALIAHSSVIRSQVAPIVAAAAGTHHAATHNATQQERVLAIPGGCFSLHVASGEHAELSAAAVEAVYASAGGRGLLRQQRLAALVQALATASASASAARNREQLNQDQGGGGDDGSDDGQDGGYGASMLAARQQERLRQYLRSIGAISCEWSGSKIGLFEDAAVSARGECTRASLVPFLVAFRAFGLMFAGGCIFKGSPFFEDLEIACGKAKTIRPPIIASITADPRPR
jgi:pseudouridine synthase